MIEEFILNNAQGFVGMIILGYLHYLTIKNIQNRLELHAQALYSLEERVNEIADQLN